MTWSSCSPSRSSSASGEPMAATAAGAASAGNVATAVRALRRLSIDMASSPLVLLVGLPFFGIHYMYIEPNVKDSMYMERIFSPPLAESGIKGRMPRRKVFETNINLPITGAQLARIAAVLRVDVGEARAAFI